eukprot:GILI01027150.1.p1 GENE.GILI01027150.1~~GILI01027150.1.p1  ORF type:complete len:205 (-),score=20.62 GILI01027150.1:74-688(-)
MDYSGDQTYLIASLLGGLALFAVPTFLLHSSCKDEITRIKRILAFNRFLCLVMGLTSLPLLLYIPSAFYVLRPPLVAWSAVFGAFSQDHQFFRLFFITTASLFIIGDAYSETVWDQQIECVWDGKCVSTMSTLIMLVLWSRDLFAITVQIAALTCVAYLCNCLGWLSNKRLPKKIDYEDTPFPVHQRKRFDLAYFMPHGVYERL